MEILSIRPVHGEGKIRARIDVRFDNGVIARNLELRQTGAGLRVFGARVRGELVVALPPSIVEEIVREVVHVAA